MDDDSRPSTADESPARIAEQTRLLASLSDDDLLRRLAAILSQSRRVETDLVAHIAEVDERRLYAREAFPSMFAYCTDALHLSEGEAYLRIAVARASREHPVVLAMLGDGRLHLSGIAVLAPHLTPENREMLLRRATHRSKREIQELMAEIAPQQDVPALMRKLPDRTTSPAAPASTLSGMGTLVTRGSVHALEGHGPAAVSIPPDASVSIPPAPVPSSPPPAVQPLSPGRYKVQFTASAQLRDKLERLLALMRSQVPDGDLGAVIEAAVTEKLERLEARRFAATKHPRTTVSKADTSPDSRYIPAAVRRAVRERDGNRCRFVDPAGRRCEERHRLRYHHLHPFGMGGDHRPENIRLMCKRHNDYLAEIDYGREAMAQFYRRGARVTGPATVTSIGTTVIPARARPICDRLR